jgi:hypothetical protein
VEELLGEALDVVWRVTAVDLGGDLVDAEEAAEVHLLAGEVRHAAGRAFEAEHHVALELVLGALEFFVADGFFFETAQLGEGELEDLAVLSTEVPA